MLLTFLLLSLPGAPPSARLPQSAAVPPAREPVADEPRGRLLFTRQLQGRDDLFVLHLPEGRLEQLTDHRAKDSHGVPSPDGQRIVFSSERRGWWKIWSMNADGSALEQLTSPRSGADYSPCWSPDGRRVAYVSGSQGNGDVLCRALDDGTTANLTDHPARDNFPAWAPDGESIVFCSDRAERWSLYRMRPDGGGVTRLTHDGDALEPAWFPDGRRLAYESTAADATRAQLWTLALAEGAPFGDPTCLSDGASSDERPAVSPDGRWIAYESDRAGGSQLFLIPSSGGTPRQLTQEGYCYAAAWFPANER